MPRRASSRPLLSASALLLAASAFASTVSAQTYRVDDGTPGGSLTYAFPEDLCWLDVLHVNGTATLTSIEAILGDAPDGHPVTLCVWKDLAQYGQPGDGLLLTKVQTTVRNCGKQLLTSYPIPPTQVSGTFFVGAVMTVDGSMSPMTLDPHTPTLQRAWFAWGYGPGTFNPDYLGLWTWYSPPNIGFQGVFMLRANGANGPTPEARCIAKVNSEGCTPNLSFVGACSASAPSGFDIVASNVLNKKVGMLFYTLGGSQQVPFAGGWLCVGSPVRRTLALLSGGSASGTDCTGVYTFDFNTWIAAGKDKTLVAGVTVDGQFWSRDPGFAAPNDIGLTQAAHFGIAP